MNPLVFLSSMMLKYRKMATISENVETLLALQKQIMTESKYYRMYTNFATEETLSPLEIIHP